MKAAVKKVRQNPLAQKIFGRQTPPAKPDEAGTHDDYLFVIRCFRFLNLGIVMCLGAAAIYFFTQSVGWLNEPRPVLPGETASTEEVSGDDISVSLVPFDRYRDVFSQQDIFYSGPQQEDGGEVVPQSTVPLNSLVRVSGLLVGEPSQVIVEDLRANESRFLQPGDSIHGATVKDISESRVIFQYNGQEVSLSP